MLPDDPESVSYWGNVSVSAMNMDSDEPVLTIGTAIPEPVTRASVLAAFAGLTHYLRKRR